MKATYHTRVQGYTGVDRAVGDGLLSAYGELYGRVERKLFAQVAAGCGAASLKSDFLERYGIPARMFNAVRVSLEGKISSVKEQRLLRRDDLRRRIERAQDQIARSGPEARPDWLHQKKRRLGNLRARLEKLALDIDSNRISLCFGSRRLWRKQYALESNGYSGHSEWLKGWYSARSDEFFVLGSRDETAGCQLCVARVSEDGSLTLKLRLPSCLSAEQGKYLVIPSLRFKYGQEQVLAALESNAEYSAFRRQHGEKAARLSGLGQAISYRFKRDGKGWRVFLTTDMSEAPLVTDRARGAVGVDVNADHLAVSETDASGNYVRAFSVPLVTQGKSRHRAEAHIGDAVAYVVAYAGEVGKPLVLEKLDFRQKKAVLEGESPRYSRMLSSFSYAKVKACFLSRGIREGVEVHQVNPAFSSVIGRVKFMERYGLSVHQAAALALARRLLGCSEGIPRLRVAPIGYGVQVAFAVPARKRVKHVWTLWGCVLGQLRLALAAQHRLGMRRRGPNPVRAPAWAGTSSMFPGESPGRSRLELLGRRSAKSGSSEKADGDYVTKVIPFNNGIDQ